MFLQLKTYVWPAPLFYVGGGWGIFDITFGTSNITFGRPVASVNICFDPSSRDVATVTLCNIYRCLKPHRRGSKVFRSEKHMFLFDPKLDEIYVGNIIKTYVSSNICFWFDPTLREFANKALFPKSVCQKRLRCRQKRLSYESVYIHKRSTDDCQSTFSQAYWHTYWQEALFNLLRFP